MAKELSRAAALERSLIKRFRKELWKPFIVAVQRYRLVEEGCRVGVPLAADAGMILAAKLLQELHRHSPVPFALSLRCEDRELLPLLGEWGLTPDPCPEPCGREVFPLHLDDLAETTLADLLFHGELRGTLPRICREGEAELILPLFCIRRADIEAFARYNALPFPLLRRAAPGSPSSMEDRDEAARVLAFIRESNPDVDVGIYRALHSAQTDTFAAVSGLSC